MNLDVTLPLSVYSNKGAYALLLGSGISRSAGIPTATEIVSELISMAATVLNEPCGPNPTAWYKAKFGHDPEYSQLLETLIKTSTERGYLLRDCFEASKEDREQDLKQPTRAHKAIAALMKAGYLRVIVTTNFDRLMEQALAAEGVQPDVIRSAEDLRGTVPLPFAHSTIIKIHGDYLDTRSRNTTSELAEYPPPLRELLERVFRDFGLIVCGWSGESDSALREILKRAKSSHFSTFWTTRSGKLQNKVKIVADARGAETVTIKDADSFFVDLSDRVFALEKLAMRRPVSTSMAVARLKKYLSKAEYRVDLHDLLRDEVEFAYAKVRTETPSFSEMATDAERMEQQLSFYEKEIGTVLALLSCGAFWSQPNQYEWLLESFKRFARDPKLQNDLHLRRYPVLVLFYGMGISALLGKKYDFLKLLLTNDISLDDYGNPDPTALLLSNETVIDLKDQQNLTGVQRLTPLSEHLSTQLRASLGDFCPDDKTYYEAFDLFEYTLSLVNWDLIVNSRKEASLGVGGPLRGCFCWRNAGNWRDILVRTRLEENEPRPEAVLSILALNLFGTAGNQCDTPRFRSAKEKVDAEIRECRAHWHIRG